MGNSISAPVNRPPQVEAPMPQVNLQMGRVNSEGARAVAVQGPQQNSAHNKAKADVSSSFNVPPAVADRIISNTAAAMDKSTSGTASTQGVNTYMKSFGLPAVVARAVGSAVSSNLPPTVSTPINVALSGVGPALHTAAAGSSGPGDESSKFVKNEGQSLPENAVGKAFRPFTFILPVGNMAVQTATYFAASNLRANGNESLASAAENLSNVLLLGPGALSAIHTVRNVFAAQSEAGFSLQQPILNADGSTAGTITSHKDTITNADGNSEIGKISINVDGATYKAVFEQSDDGEVSIRHLPANRFAAAAPAAEAVAEAAPEAAQADLNAEDIEFFDAPLAVFGANSGNQGADLNDDVFYDAQSSAIRVADANEAPNAGASGSERSASQSISEATVTDVASADAPPANAAPDAPAGPSALVKARIVEAVKVGSMVSTVGYTQAALAFTTPALNAVLTSNGLSEQQAKDVTAVTNTAISNALLGIEFIPKWMQNDVPIKSSEPPAQQPALNEPNDAIDAAERGVAGQNDQAADGAPEPAQDSMFKKIGDAISSANDYFRHTPVGKVVGSLMPFGGTFQSATRNTEMYDAPKLSSTVFESYAVNQAKMLSATKSQAADSVELVDNKMKLNLPNLVTYMVANAAPQQE